MIGVYGGTFDPVHYGHLRTSLEVWEALELDELRFVPCQIPAHRGTPGATPEQRLAMLRAALADAPPGIRIDTRELERAGASFMVDTLSSLRDDIGNTAPLILILGSDAFQGLHRWHCWQSLAELAHIVVMQRPGIERTWPAELEGYFAKCICQQPKDMKTRPAGLIHFMAVSQLEISASHIRQLVGYQKSAQYLTPQSVIRLIDQNQLYRQVEFRSNRQEASS
jgi:nicotinate-nucleotide adenylyltransferase